jgi:hypothetical protein
MAKSTFAAPACDTAAKAAVKKLSSGNAKIRIAAADQLVLLGDCAIQHLPAELEPDEPALYHVYGILGNSIVNAIKAGFEPSALQKFAGIQYLSSDDQSPASEPNRKKLAEVTAKIDRAAASLNLATVKKLARQSFTAADGSSYFGIEWSGPGIVTSCYRFYHSFKKDGQSQAFLNAESGILQCGNLKAILPQGNPLKAIAYIIDVGSGTIYSLYDPATMKELCRTTGKMIDDTPAETRRQYETFLGRLDAKAATDCGLKN